jgi:hypothetical protein
VVTVLDPGAYANHIHYVSYLPIEQKGEPRETKDRPKAVSAKNLERFNNTPSISQTRASPHQSARMQDL